MVANKRQNNGREGQMVIIINQKEKNWAEKKKGVRINKEVFKFV